GLYFFSKVSGDKTTPSSGSIMPRPLRFPSRVSCLFSVSRNISTLSSLRCSPRVSAKASAKISCALAAPTTSLRASYMGNQRGCLGRPPTSCRAGNHLNPGQTNPLRQTFLHFPGDAPADGGTHGNPTHGSGQQLRHRGSGGGDLDGGKSASERMPTMLHSKKISKFQNSKM